MSAPEVGEVLAAGGQRVAFQAGEFLAELEVEAFARGVGVGIDVEGGGEACVEAQEELQVVPPEECGGGYGYGFAAGGEHRPAVGTAFGDVERFAGAEPLEHGEIVDSAAAPLGEAEAGTVGGEVPVLEPDEAPFGGVVGYLEPFAALTVAPGGEAAPADHGGADPALFVEELLCPLAEPRLTEIGFVAGGVEGLRGGPLFCPRVGRGEGRGAVGEPPAGVAEVEAEGPHHEVYGAAAGVAYEAPEGVSADVEREAGMAVAVEGAEGLVGVYLEPEALRHLLYRKEAEPLEFVPGHRSSRLR